MCDHTGPFDDGLLTCTRTAHEGNGHIYLSTDGSSVDDHHTDGGHG